MEKNLNMSKNNQYSALHVGGLMLTCTSLGGGRHTTIFEHLNANILHSVCCSEWKHLDIEILFRYHYVLALVPTHSLSKFRNWKK